MKHQGGRKTRILVPPTCHEKNPHEVKTSYAPRRRKVGPENLREKI